MANQVDMIFWDVQHGSATYIKTPNNRHIVIDLGTGDYSGRNQLFSPLEALRNRYSISKLDHVIITHPHKDHLDDILRFDSFSPSTLHTPRYLSDAEIMSGVKPYDKPKFDKYCEIRRRYSEDVAVGSSNDITCEQQYGGVKFSVFTTPALPNSNFNNHSILTVISYLGLKVIIPGDNEHASIDLLMQRQDFKNVIKDADILLAPHHGRESAYHNDFVTLANPRITIVSDGSVCDTSANHRYSQKSRGWTVHDKKNGGSYQRKCLTTNSDGEIYVSLGNTGTNNFLQVSTY